MFGSSTTSFVISLTIIGIIIEKTIINTPNIITSEIIAAMLFFSPNFVNLFFSGVDNQHTIIPINTGINATNISTNFDIIPRFLST